MNRYIPIELVANMLSFVGFDKSTLKLRLVNKTFFNELDDKFIEWVKAKVRKDFFLANISHHIHKNWLYRGNKPAPIRKKINDIVVKTYTCLECSKLIPNIYWDEHRICFVCKKQHIHFGIMHTDMRLMCSGVCGGVVISTYNRLYCVCNECVVMVRCGVCDYIHTSTLSGIRNFYILDDISDEYPANYCHCRANYNVELVTKCNKKPIKLI